MDPFELEQMRAACRATATGFEAVVAELPRAKLEQEKVLRLMGGWAA